MASRDPQTSYIKHHDNTSLLLQDQSVYSYYYLTTYCLTITFLYYHVITITEFQYFDATYLHSLLLIMSYEIINVGIEYGLHAAVPLSNTPMHSNTEKRESRHFWKSDQLPFAKWCNFF